MKEEPRTLTSENEDDHAANPCVAPVSSERRKISLADDGEAVEAGAVGKEIERRVRIEGRSSLSESRKNSTHIRAKMTQRPKSPSLRIKGRLAPPRVNGPLLEG